MASSKRGANGSAPKPDPVIATESAPGATSGASDAGKTTPTSPVGEVRQTPPDHATVEPEPVLAPPPPLPPAGEGGPGEPVARRRGRPRGSTNRRADPSEFVLNPSAPEFHVSGRTIAAPDNDKRYRANAQMIVSVAISALESTIPNWEKCEPAEKTFLEDATYEYVKSKNLPDLPPGWVLIIAVAMYAGPRIQRNEFILRKIAGYKK